MNSPLSGLAALMSVVMSLAGCAVTAGTAVVTSTPSISLPKNPTSPDAAPELAALVVKGRAPMTGYTRAKFGQAWADVDRNGCDTRDDILKRDLESATFRQGTHGCVVLSGTLADPYTRKIISFTKAQAIAVQIDHVVALGDSWQTGSADWTAATRLAFANDPLNLLAVDGHANQSKSDSDAASWLPPNKAFRCAYVTRQVAVKTKYGLWVTPAEHDAIERVLSTCGTGS